MTTNKTSILKQAYYITRSHITLWFFGLFLLGSFNISLFKFLGLEDIITQHQGRLSEILLFYQNHPGQLAFASLAVLIFAASALILTNWSRIVLILSTHKIIEHKFTVLKNVIVESFIFLAPVIRVSILTSGFMLLVGALLFAPPFLMQPYLGGNTILWTMSGILFLPLAFGLSIINIFAVFFVVSFKIPISKAIVQATDLFIAKWHELLAFGIVLMIIYCAGLALGTGLIYFFKLMLDIISDLLVQFHFLPISAIIVVLRGIFGAIIWFLLGGLNVFLNISLLLFFLEIVKPTKSEPLKKAVPVAAAA